MSPQPTQFIFDAKQLVMNLNNELKLFNDIVESDGFVKLYPQIWDMGKSTGKVSFLDENLILYLVVLYHSIMQYNQMSSSYEQYLLLLNEETEDYIENIRNMLATLKNAIRERIVETRAVLNSQL